MKAGKIGWMLLLVAGIVLAGCGNSKNKKNEDNMVGNDKDEYGCIASAGYIWSEVQKDCIRLWEKGVRMESVANKENTAYIVFAPDSLQVELFFSGDQPNEILDRPWQSCSCLGGWHYNTSIYENNWYKSASDVVKLLVDIVSKNGNMLLSVPLRADGTFDEKEEKILNEFGEWMNVNKEAIYDTRPWEIFGEGPIAESDIKINAQGFNEGAYSKATAQEIRFTQTKKDLYATVLAWPENGNVIIKSLAADSKLFPQKIRKVELLGYGAVGFNRTAEGLSITLPSKQLNKIAPVFKIKK